LQSSSLRLIPLPHIRSPPHKRSTHTRALCVKRVPECTGPDTIQTPDLIQTSGCRMSWSILCGDGTRCPSRPCEIGVSICCPDAMFRNAIDDWTCRQRGSGNVNSMAHQGTLSRDCDNWDRLIRCQCYLENTLENTLSCYRH
jgi:hypothetical protein